MEWKILFGNNEGKHIMILLQELGSRKDLQVSQELTL